MVLRIKKGVDQSDVQPVMWFAIGIAFMVYRSHGWNARITSLTDPATGRVHDSLHPKGLAVDFGVRLLTPTQKKALLDELQEELQHMGFDVILHGAGPNEHIHIEYQPKNKQNWQVIVPS